MKVSHSVLRARIAHIVHTYNTQKDAAEAYGVSCAYLSDLLSGRRDISDEVARKFGYQQAERYFVKMEDSNA